MKTTQPIVALPIGGQWHRVRLLALDDVAENARHMAIVAAGADKPLGDVEMLAAYVSLASAILEPDAGLSPVAIATWMSGGLTAMVLAAWWQQMATLMPGEKMARA